MENEVEGAEVVVHAEQHEEELQQERVEVLMAAYVELRNDLQQDVVAAAAATAQRTASMLAGFQALRDALRAETSAAAAAAAARGNDEREADALPPHPPPVADEDEVGAVSNDDDGPVSLNANGFRGAVTILEDVNDLRPIRNLAIHYPSSANEDQDHLFFRRFVQLLGSEQEEGEGDHRRLRDVTEVGFYTDLRELPADDMERLFRDVLPSHRSVRGTHVYVDRIPAQYFQLLTESIPEATSAAASLWNLYVDSIGDDPELTALAVQAIVRMLNRNAAVGTLTVSLALDRHQCHLICEAVSGNSSNSSTNLSHLLLNVPEVLADTLNVAALSSSSSSLRQLCIRGNFADDDAIPSITRQWRTNETLQSLELLDLVDHGTRGDAWALLDLVKTYNYTLDRVRLYLPSGSVDPRLAVQLESYRLRNARIRNVMEQLRNSDPTRPQEPLSSLLALVSDVPTALYRILKLRHMDVVDAAAAAAGRRHNRRVDEEED